LQALQKIKSNHVVEVRDVGQIGQLPYLVMEFLRGTNLQTYCLRFQSLPIHETLRIAIESIQGLSAIHSAGIVHRDLKPSNLWVEAPSLNVKIIDLGLAHAMTEEMRLTRTGTFIGTPAFMSPEQAGGGTIDHRSDFFSLGCVFYELATNTRAFDRGNLMATLSALANHTPTNPAELLPQNPNDFADLIMQLLEKKPMDRPNSCAEIQAKLEQTITRLG
jgi:serine/threonine protein kinase